MMLVSEDFIVGYQLALQEEVEMPRLRSCIAAVWRGRADIAGFAARFQSEFGQSISEGHLRMVLESWWLLQAAGWELELRPRSLKEGLIFVDLTSRQSLKEHRQTSARWPATTCRACLPPPSATSPALSCRV